MVKPIRKAVRTFVIQDNKVLAIKEFNKKNFNYTEKTFLMINLRKKGTSNI